MQSYGDFRLIPRNCAISSSTCVDKRPIFGQIAENGKKVVQRFVFSIFIRIFATRKKSWPAVMTSRYICITTSGYWKAAG